MLFFDSQLAYENEIKDIGLEKEMHNVKRIALRKLSSIVAHFNSEIACILAHGWFFGLPDAERLAEQLDLSKIDFLAIQGDLEGFKEEFLNEQDKHLNY